MSSLCLFASYLDGPGIPYYCRVYLEELKKHFTEVVYLYSNEMDQSANQFLQSTAIKAQYFQNEGFDFGMWYKAFQKFDVESFDQIVLVNDSTILFSPLNGFISWSKSNVADMQGMTYSEAVAPHLQSYFLLINKSAIQPVKDYFEAHKILANISEVIRTYEIGLSTYLLAKGLKIAAYMDNNGYHGEFAPYYYCIDHHFSKGIPLIKKKIMFSSYRKDELFTLARMNFKMSTAHYVQLIKRSNKHLILDFEKLRQDRSASISFLSRTTYELTRKAISLLHLFSKKNRPA